MRRMLATLTPLAAAAALGGCLGEDDSGFTTTTGDRVTTVSPQQPEEPLPTLDYVARINDAQNAFATDVARIELASPDSPTAFKAGLERLLPTLDELIERLEALRAPSVAAGAHARLVSILAAYRRLLAEEKDAIVSEDRAEARAASTRITDASNRFGRDFKRAVAQVNDQLGA